MAQTGQHSSREGPAAPDARAVFEILVRENADMLEAYLRTLLFSGESIDDLFQETMLVAWRRLDDYDRARPFAAWLRGIAHILVLEHARKGRARPSTMDPNVLAEIDTRFESIARLPGDTFLDRASSLSKCLEKLPDSMREAVTLVYERCLTITAAAGVIGDSVESVKKRVQRARQLLAQCLGLGSKSP